MAVAVCPRCGSSDIRPVAPGYFECLQSDPQRGGSDRDRCYTRFRDETEGATAGGALCACGTRGIGRCSTCGREVCGDHSRLVADRRYCSAHARLAWDEEVANAAAEASPPSVDEFFDLDRHMTNARAEIARRRDAQARAREYLDQETALRAERSAGLDRVLRDFLARMGARDNPGLDSAVGQVRARFRRSRVDFETRLGWKLASFSYSEHGGSGRRFVFLDVDGILWVEVGGPSLRRFSEDDRAPHRRYCAISDPAGGAGDTRSLDEAIVREISLLLARHT